MLRLLPVLFIPPILILNVPESLNAQEHSFRVYEQYGVTIAETSGGPKYSEPIITYVEMLRLQQNPSAEESLLFRPRQFTRGPDGHYYVIDAGNHRIAVYDANGIYQRSFGGEGEGPGTFRNMAYQCLHEGVLHIYDRQLFRTTRMRLDGSLIEVLIRPRLNFLEFPLRYRLTEDKQLLLYNISHYGEKYLWQQANVLIVDAEFDTIACIATDSVSAGILGEGGRGSYFPIHYPGVPCSDFSPGQGILMTDGQTSVINQYSTGGILVGRIVVDIPPAPVTREERRRIIAEADRQVRESTGQMKNTFKIMRDVLTIPEEKGWWWDMKLDNAGYIWLAVVEDPFSLEESGGRTLCDLISPEGEYLGRSRLPARFNNCVMIDGCVCATLQVEKTGEYRLTVFQIQPAAEGFKYP